MNVLKFFQPYRAKNLNNLNKLQNRNLITLFYRENYLGSRTKRSMLRLYLIN